MAPGARPDTWFLVGFFLLVAGLGWLLGATATIVGPVIAAAIVATVRRLSSAHCSVIACHALQALRSFCSRCSRSAS